MSVGADLSTLQTLHKTFQQNALAATDIKTTVDTALEGAVWTGKFATDFETAWTDYRANLDRLQEALDAAAADVKTNHNNIASATGEADRIV